MLLFFIRVIPYRVKNLCLMVALAVTIPMIVGLLAEPTQGALLQGPHVLALMAEELGHAKTLQVEQQVIFEDAKIADKQLILNETLYFIFPAKVRSEMVYQNTQRVQVVSGEQALTIIDNKITRTEVGRFDRYTELLLHRSALQLFKRLALGGIDVGIVSFGRQDTEVCYVIGAQFPDETVSQLWVDKDKFLPMRWLTTRPVGGDNSQMERWEFVYTSWQKVKDIFYPFKIETLHNGKRIRSIRVNKVQVDAPIDATLFNISQLRSNYPIENIKTSPESDPSSDDSSTQMDEVQHAIEDFKRKFEP